MKKVIVGLLVLTFTFALSGNAMAKPPIMAEVINVTPNPVAYLGTIQVTTRINKVPTKTGQELLISYLCKNSEGVPVIGNLDSLNEALGTQVTEFTLGTTTLWSGEPLSCQAYIWLEELNDAKTRIIKGSEYNFTTN